MNPKAEGLQESEFEIIGEASDGEELELTHERKREIDAILKITEQEIAEGKIQYIPWREYISEVLSKRNKAKEQKEDVQQIQ